MDKKKHKRRNRFDFFQNKSKNTVLRAASRTVEELIQEEIMYGDYVQSWEPHGLLKS